MAVAIVVSTAFLIDNRETKLTEVVSADHPYLLFSDADADSGGAMHTRCTTSYGTNNICYEFISGSYQMPTDITAASDPTVADIEDKKAMNAIRDATALAFRYQISDTNLYAERAIHIVMQFMYSNYGSGTLRHNFNGINANLNANNTHSVVRKPFRNWSLPYALGMIYDWCYPIGDNITYSGTTYNGWRAKFRTSAIELIRACLEGDGQNGDPNITAAYQFNGALNNFPAGWAAASFLLMAIEPEEESNTNLYAPSIPNPPTQETGYRTGNGTQGFPSSATVANNVNNPDIVWDSTSPETTIEKLMDYASWAFKDATQPYGGQEETRAYGIIISSLYLSALAAKRNDYGTTNTAYRDIINSSIKLDAKWWCHSVLSKLPAYEGDLDYSSSDGWANYDKCIPPWLYHIADTENDSFLFYLLEELRAKESTNLGAGPIPTASNGNSCYMGFIDPRVLFCIFYDRTMAGTAPTVKSSYYPDETNHSILSDRYTAYDGTVTTGGRYYLFNDADGNRDKLSVAHYVRNEYASHMHEDSGHIEIHSEDESFYVDIGRADAGQAFRGGQTYSHNIVAAVVTNSDSPVSGQYSSSNDKDESNYLGDNTNYYTEPANNATFSGITSSVLAWGYDFVRTDPGIHWTTDRSGSSNTTMSTKNRNIVMIKDVDTPYVVVIDEVDGGSSSLKYRQKWWSPVVLTEANGTGSWLVSGLSGDIDEPWTATTNSKTLKTFWLEPRSSGVLTLEHYMEYDTNRDNGDGNREVFHNFAQTTTATTDAVVFMTVFRRLIENGATTFDIGATSQVKGRGIAWSSESLDYHYYNTATTLNPSWFTDSRGLYTFFRILDGGNGEGTVSNYILVKCKRVEWQDSSEMVEKITFLETLDSSASAEFEVNLSYRTIGSDTKVEIDMNGFVNNTNDYIKFYSPISITEDQIGLTNFSGNDAWTVSLPGSFPGVVTVTQN